SGSAPGKCSGKDKLMKPEERRIKSVLYLIAMLERLSVDSYWAHQASGLRGSLLRGMEQLEAGKMKAGQLELFDRLVEQGYRVLEKAAEELRGSESQ
ncbi:MAG: hypothetical protein ACM3PY_03770, partial [Omnitrophica WOR_2 bacterium]